MRTDECEGGAGGGRNVEGVRPDLMDELNAEFLLKGTPPTGTIAQFFLSGAKITSPAPFRPPPAGRGIAVLFRLSALLDRRPRSSSEHALGGP